MKHTAPIFKILAAVVLAGVLLFFGVQMYQYYSDPFTTTLVYAAQTDDTISVDGWMVRQEETLHAALLFQRFQIPPDGGRGHMEMLRQIDHRRQLLLP